MQTGGLLGSSAPTGSGLQDEGPPSRVELKDLAVFSRQFATKINSGLSLLRALTILGEQTSNRRLGEVIVQVRAEVEKGTSLSAAIAKHPKVFNRLYVSMVRAARSAASSTRSWSRWPRPSRRRSPCGARSARP
jgi:type IV pilus assembly protein PilC